MEISRRNLMLGASCRPLCWQPLRATAALALRRHPLPAAMIGGMFGPKDGIALLSRNENPYGPSPKAQAGSRGLRPQRGPIMPTLPSNVLTKMIAEKYGVSPEQVVIGTGSGEVLNAIALAWKPKGAYLGADLFWDTTAKWGVKLGGDAQDRADDPGDGGRSARASPPPSTTRSAWSTSSTPTTPPGC